MPGTTLQSAQARCGKPLACPEPHWLVIDPHTSHTRHPPPEALTARPRERTSSLFCCRPSYTLQGSRVAPAEESRLCSPAAGGGRHPPLGKRQPRTFHRDPSWEESSLHPENKNLFPGSRLQPEQRPPSSTDADLCYWRVNLLSWRCCFCSWSSRTEGSFPHKGVILGDGAAAKHLPVPACRQSTRPLPAHSQAGKTHSVAGQEKERGVAENGEQSQKGW